MVARFVKARIADGAWIRHMFTEAQRLSREYGKENVFDFSLGNPVLEPPPVFKQALLKLIQSDEKGLHRYMEASGLQEVRRYLANKLSQEHDLAFTHKHITLCVGAGGGLNIVFKSLLNPGDEVVALKPFFPEYRNYVPNHGGVLREVATTDDFQIDFAQLESAITSQTSAVLINSPNNPTGAIYPEADLQKLAQLLTKKSQGREVPIYLITDEPYAKILFDDAEFAPPVRYYEHTIVVTSYSKDLAIPGERIGYVVVSPHCFEADELIDALSWSQLALGLVSAPALMQRVIPLVGDACVNLDMYQRNRDILWEHFMQLGVQCVKPQGAFYFFPRTPIADDGLFACNALRERLVMVPGRAFGVPHHVRLSFCVHTETVLRSLKPLANAFQSSQKKDRVAHAEGPI